MNILFYTPLNTRCRDIESQSIEFSNNGHRIFLLSQGGEGEIHDGFRAYGYTAAADHAYSRNTKWLTLKRWFSLIRFCKKFKIDLLYAHLEPANFVAVLAQSFIRTRVIICRHHVDEAKLYPFGKDLSYRLTYLLAKEIVVVSGRAKEYMVKEENIPPHKIHVIKLSYDFALYPQPDKSRAVEIQRAQASDLILLSVCRLTRFKRAEQAIYVAEELVRMGINVKLIILGKGEEHPNLQNYIESKNLTNHVFLKGFVPNVTDYMAAADLLLHPSLLDSSSISFKEASLVDLPMIACKDVGDFNEVITHERNGFLVSADNFVNEAVSIVGEYVRKKEILKTMGARSRQLVLEYFDIKKNAPYYEQVFHTRVQ
jgi:glycosyltransferase involved in cell wall biosynthesis